MFPGSGITVFTYLATPYRWWVAFVRMAEDYLSEEAKRGGK